MPETPEIEKLEPRLARLVESGLCDAKDSKKYERELAALVENTSGGKDLESLAYYFKALSDETRLKMAYALISKEMCECEIMAALGVNQSTASHHLRVLQRSGVVSRRKDGKWVFYRTKGRLLKQILDLAATDGSPGR